MNSGIKQFFFFVLLFALSVIRGGEINAVLATVNGHPVFLGDILPMTRSAEYQAHAAFKGSELERRIKELRRQAVNDFIDRRLLLGAYEAAPFKLPPGMVDQRMDDHAVRMGCNSRREFAVLLRKEKSSVEELRKLITEQLTAELTLYRQIQPGIQVSPQEVYEYYKNNPALFSTAAFFELAMILLAKDTPPEEAKRIGEEILGDPANFSAFARQYSKGPNAAAGGDLGRIAGNLLRKEFAAALKKPETGKVYGPLPTADGIAFLKLYGHQQEKKTPFSEAALEIKRKLETQKRTENIQKYLKKLRSEAVIRIFF